MMYFSIDKTPFIQHSFMIRGICAEFRNLVTKGRPGAPPETGREKAGREAGISASRGGDEKMPEKKDAPLLGARPSKSLFIS
jgi:hypothetical protein